MANQKRERRLTEEQRSERAERFEQLPYDVAMRAIDRMSEQERDDLFDTVESRIGM